MTLRSGGGEFGSHFSQVRLPSFCSRPRYSGERLAESSVSLVVGYLGRGGVGSPSSPAMSTNRTVVSSFPRSSALAVAERAAASAASFCSRRSWASVVVKHCCCACCGNKGGLVSAFGRDPDFTHKSVVGFSVLPTDKVSDRRIRPVSNGLGRRATD
jgi:hypothetical protein